MSRNPFPGPQPYRASDRGRFYGRDDVAYKLQGSILANRCVTVYGPSGAGKSSVMQASVIPTIIEAHDARVVRVDGWPEDQDPTRWLADAVYGELGLGERPADLAPDEALLAAAQRAARRSSRIVLVYLDQMEQLLYATRSPAESEAFFDCVNRLAELPLRNLRVVLSLREDYLGRFRDRLRDHRRILDHGFRVGPLTVAELCGAVCQAAADGEPPQTWTEDEMRGLMLQVRVPGQAESDDAEAQAAYAQIVCRALFQQRAAGSTASATEAEPILRRYLETTLDSLGEKRGLAQQLLEDHLVTADGSRTLRTEKELLRVVTQAELGPILKALEGAAILHAEEHQGSRYFEIGHDWLARKVFEQRHAREEEEEQRRERAVTAARQAKERAQRRTLVFIAAASLAIAAGTGALGFWAWKEKGKAEVATAAAEKATAAADELRIKAEKERVAAHDARVLSGFRELSIRGQIAWALKLLPEVERPASARGWAELASEALDQSALRSSLIGHESALAAALYSPDGQSVLTASADKTARVWSADGKGMPVVLKGHEGPLRAAAWSPDGKSVLTGADDGSARVWSADGKGTPVVLKGHGGPVLAVAWSPDGKRVLTASVDGAARVWSADGSGEAAALKGHKGPVTAAIFLPDGRIVTGGSDGTVRLWLADASGNHRVLNGHRAEVLAIAASRDGELFVSASADKTARVWRAEGTSAPVVLLGHTSSVYSVDISGDGKRVVTASGDRTARVWSTDGRSKPVILAGHQLTVKSAAFSRDGKYVVTGGADKTARIWSVAGGEAILVLRGHDAPVRSACFNADGTRVLTAAADKTDLSTDRTAKIWSTEIHGAPQEQHQGGAPHSASVGKDGDHVASAYDDNTARVFRMGSAEKPVVLKGHEGWVSSAALSPSGDRVVTSSFDKTARVWKADGSGEPVVLKGHEAEVRDAAWSPDGTQVVTVSEDRTARVWKADGSGDPVVLRGHEDWLTSAAFSPDGARVVTTSLDHTARVWKADGSGAPVVLAGHAGDVLSAIWSRDGSEIVTTSEDHTARLWRADGSGDPVVLRAPGGAMLRALFSPDEKRLVVASADGTLSVFLLETKAPPTVLDAKAQVLTMAFVGEHGKTLLTLGADGSAHSWMVDVGELKSRLESADTDCLPVAVRTLYLGETTRAARERYAECERKQDRTPLLPGGTTP